MFSSRVSLAPSNARPLKAVRCPELRVCTNVGGTRKLDVSCCSRSRSDDRSSSDWGNSASSVIHPTSVYSSNYATRPPEEKQQPASSIADSGSEPSVSAAEPVELTVYSVRLTTGSMRGAALSSPHSGVNILLVSEDGRSVLHRITPLNDPAANAKAIEEICSAVGENSYEGVGANCLVINAMRKVNPNREGAAYKEGMDPTKEGSPKPTVESCKLRFQEGCVDEVCFLAPELGPLAGALVGTESGTWLLDEMQVSSSRTGHADRFVCRRKLGVSRGEGASWLTPVPEGAVVYGSGDNSIILTKEQAQTLRSMDMSDYGSLKQRLLLATFMLTAGGSGLAGMLGGIPAAWPFAAGGLIGCMYQWMLQQGVDSMVLTPAEGELGGQAPYQPGSAAKRLAGSPAVRLAVVAASAYAAMSLAMQTEAERACSGAACAASVAMVSSAGSGSPMWQFMIGVLGFMTYKLALVGVAMAPSTPADISDKLKSKANQMEAL